MPMLKGLLLLAMYHHSVLLSVVGGVVEARTGRLHLAKRMPAEDNPVIEVLNLLIFAFFDDFPSDSMSTASSEQKALVKLAMCRICAFLMYNSTAFAHSMKLPTLA